MAHGGKNKSVYTQEQVNQMNARAVASARRQWDGVVRSWNQSLPNIGRMISPYTSKIQDLGGKSWKSTKLSELERMKSISEGNESALQGVMAEGWDNSGMPQRSDHGSVSLMTTSGNAYNSNIFTNPNLSHWQGTSPSEGPDIGETVQPYLDTIQSNLGKLTKWHTDRGAAEEKYNTFREGIRSEIGDLVGNAYGLSIADGDDIETGLSDYTDIEGRLSGFETPLQDFTDFSWSNRQLGRANTKLGALKTKRDNELTRIKNAKEDFEDRISNSESAFGGYTIADEEGMGTLEDTLRKLNREVGSFNTVISDEYDNTNYLGDIDDLGVKLANLKQDRRDELSRISSDTSRLKSQASGLGSMTRRMGTYDLGSINDAQDLIDEGLSDISGYESLLDFSDITNLGSDFTGYDTKLSDLLTKRSGELDQYETDLSDYGTELSGLDLWEERKMRDISTRLNRQAGKLGMYSGGRAPGIQDNYVSGDADIFSRLTDLEDKRDDFETQAANYLNDARGGFYTTGDLDTMQNNYDTLYSDVQKYGADQAQDELSALSEAIRNEEARFAAEQAAKKKAEEEAARMAGGNQFMYGLGGRALTPAEYANLLSKRRDNETVSTQGLLSSLLS